MIPQRAFALRVAPPPAREDEVEDAMSRIRTSKTWTREQASTAVTMALSGKTRSQIALAIGKSRSAVAAFLWRNDVARKDSKIDPWR